MNHVQGGPYCIRNKRATLNLFRSGCLTFYEWVENQCRGNHGHPVEYGLLFSHSRRFICCLAIAVYSQVRRFTLSLTSSTFSVMEPFFFSLLKGLPQNDRCKLAIMLLLNTNTLIIDLAVWCLHAVFYHRELCDARGSASATAWLLPFAIWLLWKNKTPDVQVRALERGGTFTK